MYFIFEALIECLHFAEPLFFRLYLFGRFLLFFVFGWRILCTILPLLCGIFFFGEDVLQDTSYDVCLFY